MSLSSEVSSAFSSIGLLQIDDEILSKCVGLSKCLHLSPSQMVEIWEAHSTTKNVVELTSSTFDGYRNALLKESDSSDSPSRDGAVVTTIGLGKRNLPLVTPPSKRRLHGETPSTNGRQTTSAVDGVSVSRDAASPQRKMTNKPVNLPKYSERKDIGKVVASYNPHKLLPIKQDGHPVAPRCTVAWENCNTNVKSAYRHMFTPLEERARCLDNLLVQMGEEIVQCHGLTEDRSDIPKVEAVGVPRPEKVFSIGRVCNESHEGRLNQKSVLLEGCSHLSGGARVNVNLSHIIESKRSSFSLFPGQIIAVEGINASGREIIADQILEGAPKPTPRTSADMLQHYHHDMQGGNGLKIMSACGPFTTSDNLKYEPFHDLLRAVKMSKPDLVILAGPFVDMQHESIARGNLVLQDVEGKKTSVTSEVFFATKIAELLETLFEEEKGLKTQFVLVPNLDDAMAEWVYPQPPLSDPSPGGGKDVQLPGADGIKFGTLGLQHVETPGGGVASEVRRVHCVPNPCTLQINEVVIGISSVDILFHINSNETSANLQPGTRLARIAQHLIQQQSYYPLFPPSPETNMDLRHVEQWGMPCQPDILIVPSKLTCFAKKVLDTTIVVNPGHLSRSTTGGTYAEMEIHPLALKTLANAEEDHALEHNIQDRVRVEVRRI